MAKENVDESEERHVGGLRAGCTGQGAENCCGDKASLHFLSFCHLGCQSGHRRNRSNSTVLSSA
jgi:hypothetical protein